MAGKSELSASSGVQNVVVYVSNDNFAQAYAVGHQQNVGAPNGHGPTGYPEPPKAYPGKPQQQQLKPADFNGQPLEQQGYFVNGFPQPLVGYHNGAIVGRTKTYPGGNNSDVLSGERQAGPGRPDGLKIVRDECENHEAFVDSAGYVTVMGAEGPPQGVRCESVRSETAESSCSSLSSADESMVVVQNLPPDMVVYDSSVSVRPGGVVLTRGPSPGAQQHHMPVVTISNQPSSIDVPYGWKRLTNSGSIIYISPSNTALSSAEQVKEYLLTAGTCKCGLECHFKYDNTFNFDPKVASKPWTFSPDTNTRDLTKLCNHKRKIIAIASLDCKPPDPNVKLRKDYSTKKIKRKIGMPYSGCVSVSQILAQREKLGVNQSFAKDNIRNQQQQMYPQAVANNAMGRLQGYQEANPQNIVRYQSQDQARNGIIGSAMVMGDGSMMVQTPNISQQQTHQVPPPNPNIQIQHQHILGPNGQVISIQGPGINPSEPQQIVNSMVPNNVVLQQQQQQGQQNQSRQQHRVFINGLDPNAPGRPNMQMVPVSFASQHQGQDIQNRVRQQQQHQFYNSQYPQIQQQQQQQQFDPSKQMKYLAGNNQVMNGFRPQGVVNPQNNQIMQTSVMINNNQQRLQWTNRMQPIVNAQGQFPVQGAAQQQPPPPPHDACERVPPLHQHSPSPIPWHEEIKKKKVKLTKVVKNRPYHMMECSSMHSPCPNIDVRQIPNDNGRSVIINHLPPNSQTSVPNPSFMEDPSGYLAQQTALLNNTINRQTGASSSMGMICNSPVTSTHNNCPQIQNVTAMPISTNEVPLASNVVISHNMKQAQNVSHRTNQSLNVVKTQQVPQHNIVMTQQFNQMLAQGMADSSVINEHNLQPCCSGEGEQQQVHHQEFIIKDDQLIEQSGKVKYRSRSSSQPATPSSSETIDDSVTSSCIDKPDPRPIQGGTVSTSNVSPMDGCQSDPPTPNPHTPTSPNRNEGTIQINSSCGTPFVIYSQDEQQQSREVCSTINYQNIIPKPQEVCCSMAHSGAVTKMSESYTSGIVTTMASGRTVGSNTITSVLAGRTNTATVSVNNPAAATSSTPLVAQDTLPISKSPLEMVQSVVSSIQVPHSQNMTSQQSQMVKSHPQTNLLPGHILVSSGGQLIMANTSQPGVMPPPPPKLQNAMPPVSVSPMITNVTGAVSQVIPAVAQQVLGQQTVLVNALPAPFVLQSGMTMTMDGMVGQNMQLPLVAGNVIQQQIQIDNSDSRRNSALLSPETKKKGKKRKMSSQTVASMLQISAAQQNSGVVVSQQGFPQQIQMAHSPQGLATAPVMQAVTIVPSKTGGPPQLVMNNNANIGTQQLINSQPAQQINLLQPVNLINGTTGVVQNFPTIQQFIVPNLGGMVMNPDGTATLLQDTSNLSMQLQLQNVNGQNVLTPVQNNAVFNSGQGILTASPAGMVIRTPTSQNKIQMQQHSPGAQFLSPNGGQFVVNGQFSGQLSPLVASVSPSQQMTFPSSPQIRPQQNQEYIQCGQLGQTLMVPCTPSNANVAVSSANQNTTFVQQNTTIVQQQTTMVSNNQQLQQNFQNPQNRTTTLNVGEQNFILNDKQQVQALLVHRESPQSSYRQSVSTQTAVNQNAQSVTTNTFCQTSTLSTGSPPDTTTHSPLASDGQSPPTADTTTHSGSTDDGLSPAPSNCSGTCDSHLGKQPACTVAMVHCISSSEPDSADLNMQGSDQDWTRVQTLQKPHAAEISSRHGHKRINTPPCVAYAESSTVVPGLQFLNEQIKSQDAISSLGYEKVMHKRKNSDTMLLIETRHMHPTSFDEQDLAN